MLIIDDLSVRVAGRLLIENATVRIADGGLQAFSRTLGFGGPASKPSRRHRLSMGIPELDKMMGGVFLSATSNMAAAFTRRAASTGADALTPGLAARPPNTVDHPDDPEQPRLVPTLTDSLLRTMAIDAGVA